MLSVSDVFEASDAVVARLEKLSCGCMLAVRLPGPIVAGDGEEEK
jgi:hypothetical protein